MIRSATRPKAARPQPEKEPPRKVGRHREIDPPFDTPAGEMAWWIRHNMPATGDAAQLGPAVGKARSAGFRWFNGESLAPVDDWGGIAAFLGLGSHWSDLVPPTDFLKYLRKYKRLPSK